MLPIVVVAVAAVVAAAVQHENAIVSHSAARGKRKSMNRFLCFSLPETKKKQEQQPARGSVKCKRLSTEKVQEQAEGEARGEGLRSYGR